MKRLQVLRCFAPLAFGLSACAISSAQETLTLDRLGAITILRPAQQPPAAVSWLISGRSGPSGGAEQAVAQQLQAAGVLVLLVDGERYLDTVTPDEGSDCLFFGWDFESGAQKLERLLELHEFRQPSLIGVGDGATIALAAAAQSTINTFRGVLTLGFDPQWRSRQPLCAGDQGEVARKAPSKSGWTLAPSADWRINWIALNGAADPYTDPATLRTYVESVDGARLQQVPGIGHGFDNPPRWQAVFASAWRDLLGTQSHAEGLADLPLIELPVEQNGDWLAVILTGDGGWAALDREIGETLQSQGIPAVGFNALKYFWQARTPEQTAADISRVLAHYRATWQRSHILLIGYSFGAEVLPFVLNRLPPEERAHVALGVLLAPSREASFEFHALDWIGAGASATDLPVAPELERLRVPTLCVYGSDEAEDSACTDLPKTKNDALITWKLDGGHHFDGDYQALAKRLLETAQAVSARK